MTVSLSISPITIDLVHRDLHEHAASMWTEEQRRTDEALSVVMAYLGPGGTKRIDVCEREQVFGENFGDMLNREITIRVHGTIVWRMCWRSPRMYTLAMYDPEWAILPWEIAQKTKCFEPLRDS